LSGAICFASRVVSGEKFLITNCVFFDNHHKEGGAGSDIYDESLEEEEGEGEREKKEDKQPFVVANSYTNLLNSFVTNQKIMDDILIVLTKEQLERHKEEV
jgi:hypothetical protein